jgi:hypothetical protein
MKSNGQISRIFCLEWEYKETGMGLAMVELLSSSRGKDLGKGDVGHGAVLCFT